MDRKILQEVGLTPVEIDIYLAIIDLGSCLAGEITRKTSIHRRTVYDAIERLVEKGLVSYIKTNNRKYFEAVDPNRILEILREREHLVREIIPELEKRYSFSKEKKETLFFRGKRALKAIFDDQISEGKEVLVLASTVEIQEILEYYFPRFNIQRKEKNIQLKMLFSENLREKELVKRIPLAEIRFLPKKYGSNVSTNIYGDRISIVVWAEIPTATLIKEKAIAESYRNYFDVLWSNAKK